MAGHYDFGLTVSEPGFSFPSGKASLDVSASGTVTGSASVGKIEASYLLFGLLPVTVHYSLEIGAVSGQVTSGQWKLTLPVSLVANSIKVFGYDLLPSGSVCSTGASPATVTQTGSATVLAGSVSIGSFGAGCGLLGGPLTAVNSGTHPITVTLTH